MLTKTDFVLSRVPGTYIWHDLKKNVLFWFLEVIIYLLLGLPLKYYLILLCYENDFLQEVNAICVCLSICPSVSTCLSICLSVCLSVCQSLCLFLCLSLSVSLSVCQPVCVPVCLSVHLSFSLPACQATDYWLMFGGNLETWCKCHGVSINLRFLPTQLIFSSLESWESTIQLTDLIWASWLFFTFKYKINTTYQTQ